LKDESERHITRSLDTPESKGGHPWYLQWTVLLHTDFLLQFAY